MQYKVSSPPENTRNYWHPFQAKAKGYEEDRILGEKMAYDDVKGVQRLVQVLIEPSKITTTSGTNPMKTGLWETSF
jgi:hypothetical protein